MTLTSRTVVRNAWGIVGVATVERPWLDSHPWRILPPRSFDLSFSLLTVPECTSRVSSSPPEAGQVCSTYKYGLYSMFGFSFSVEKKWIRIVEMSSMLIFNSFYLEWNLFFLLLLLLFFWTYTYFRSKQFKSSNQRMKVVFGFGFRSETTMRNVRYFKKDGRNERKIVLPRNVNIIITIILLDKIVLLRNHE